MSVDLLLLVLLFYSLYGCKINNRESLNDNLTLNNSNSLKAVFAIVIIFCHLTNYIDTGKLFWVFDSLGTFAVSIFLFISGYGLMKQHMSNNNYSNKIITKRIPKIIKPFVIISILYIIYFLFFKEYSINGLFEKTTNMFVMGDSVVSNSWYVYINIELYLLFYFSIKIFDNKINHILVFIIVFCSLQMFIMKQMNFCMCWYITTFNFAFGVFYSYFEKKYINFIKKYYNVLLIISLIFLIVLFYINTTNNSISNWILFYIIKYIVFTFCVVLITYRIDLHNRMLCFVHSISYELYLTHGLVIMILSDYINNDFLLCILCIMFSIAIAFIIHKIDRLIINKGTNISALDK